MAPFDQAYSTGPQQAEPPVNAPDLSTLDAVFQILERATAARATIQRAFGDDWRN